MLTGELCFSLAGILVLAGTADAGGMAPPTSTSISAKLKRVQEHVSRVNAVSWCRKELRLTGSCITTGKMEWFDYKLTPNMRVAKASVTIPCLPVSLSPAYTSHSLLPTRLTLSCLHVSLSRASACHFLVPSRVTLSCLRVSLPPRVTLSCLHVSRSRATTCP